MAWENHVYYFGYWDRAAHTNIKEDRHLLSTLPSDWHADRGRLILSLSLRTISSLSEVGRMLELMNFASGGPCLHVVH